MALRDVLLNDVTVISNFGNGVDADRDVAINVGQVCNNTGEQIVAGGTIDLTLVSLGCSPLVTNSLDSGLGSLRDALLVGGEISFDMNALGPGPHTINLVSELFIVQDTTILGPGTEVVSISGGASTRLFSISEPNGDIDVEIRSLTLQDGNANGDDGGAIANEEATLTLRDVVLTGNAAEQGGAIYSVGQSDGDDDGGEYGGGGAYRLTILDSAIANSTASQGGAVWASGGLEIERTTF